MTHDNAIETMAAERYILDELDPAERDAFEEHFFDCTGCTADVRDAAKIAAGVRTRVVPAKHYSRWAAAAAVAAVAIGLAYQYMPQILHPSNPPSQAAHATPAAHAIPGEQFIELDAPRAPKEPFIILGKQSVSVDFVIPVTDPHPPYVCELRDEAGVVIGSTTVRTKDEAANAVSLVMPAGKFHNGNYTLGIRGGDREIPPYHFAVEVQ